jgi:hypothetical protein
MQYRTRNTLTAANIAAAKTIAGRIIPAAIIRGRSRIFFILRFYFLIIFVHDLHLRSDLNLITGPREFKLESEKNNRKLRERRLNAPPWTIIPDSENLWENSFAHYSY